MPFIKRKKKFLKNSKEFSVESIHDKDDLKIIQLNFGKKPSALFFGTPVESKIEVGVGANVSPTSPGGHFKFGRGKKYKWTIIDNPTLTDKYIPSDEKPNYLASSVAYASGTITTSSATKILSINPGEETQVEYLNERFDLIATDNDLIIRKRDRKQDDKMKYKYTKKSDVNYKTT